MREASLIPIFALSPSEAVAVPRQAATGSRTGRTPTAKVVNVVKCDAELDENGCRLLFTLKKVIILADCSSAICRNVVKCNAECNALHPNIDK